jgi:hypothetical protein
MCTDFINALYSYIFSPLTDFNFPCDTKLTFNINEYQGNWVCVNKKGRIWNILIGVLEYGYTFPFCSLRRLVIGLCNDG